MLASEEVRMVMIWKKIQEHFRLPYHEIGNDDCIARALGVGGCVWIFGINKDKEPAEALKIADTVLMALLKGKKLDLKSMLKIDGLIKTNIKKEAIKNYSHKKGHSFAHIRKRDNPHHPGS